MTPHTRCPTADIPDRLGPDVWVDAGRVAARSSPPEPARASFTGRQAPRSRPGARRMTPRATARTTRPRTADTTRRQTHDRQWPRGRRRVRRQLAQERGVPRDSHVGGQWDAPASRGGRQMAVTAGRGGAAAIADQKTALEVLPARREIQLHEPGLVRYELAPSGAGDTLAMTSARVLGYRCNSSGRRHVRSASLPSGEIPPGSPVRSGIIEPVR